MMPVGMQMWMCGRAALAALAALCESKKIEVLQQ